MLVDRTCNGATHQPAPDRAVPADHLSRQICDAHVRALTSPHPPDAWPEVIGRETTPPGERMVQAISGLMGVHGRDRARPRRLGLEIACVAAGLVAAQGVLASLIAARRFGGRVATVETTMLDGALMFLRHHVAIATCGDTFPFRDVAAAGPGPPFRTADDHWIELEALDGDAWLDFWTALGVPPRTSSAAWRPFVFRFLAARCALPTVLHETIGQHALVDLRPIARASRVALCVVRDYAAILADRLHTDDPWIIEETSGPDTDAAWRIRSAGAGSPADVDAQRPLRGLRVIEVASRMQGPLAGLLVQMLGAEVIKVEPPGGDFGRQAPPRARTTGAAYLAYNHRKRVIEIDYKTREGQSDLRDLAAHADVFLHNSPPGRAEAFGFDAASLTRLNPSLVHAYASGWGRRPDTPGGIASDYLVQAYAACGSGLHAADEPAFPSRLTLVDVMGGLLSVEAILAGLYRRTYTTRGCAVETSLLSAAMVAQAHVLRAMACGAERGRHGGRPLWSVLDQPIETSDGFLMIDAAGDRTYDRLAEACGLRGDVPAGADATHHMVDRFHAQSAASWVRTLREAGIASAVARTDLASLADDPQTCAALELADGCRLPGPPWRFST